DQGTVLRAGAFDDRLAARDVESRRRHAWIRTGRRCAVETGVNAVAAVAANRVRADGDIVWRRERDSELVVARNDVVVDGDIAGAHADVDAARAVRSRVADVIADDRRSARCVDKDSAATVAVDGVVANFSVELDRADAALTVTFDDVVLDDRQRRPLNRRDAV